MKKLMTMAMGAALALLASASAFAAEKYTVHLDDAQVPEGCNVKLPADKQYAEGAKVSVSVTAPKGWVFSGWETTVGEDALNEDYRSPKVSFTMPAEDVDLVPHFISIAKDYLNAEETAGVADPTAIGLNDTDAYGIEDSDIGVDEDGPYFRVDVVNDFCVVPLDIKSGSLPTVSVTGLPPGLKFTAKEITDKNYGVIPANSIYGTPTASGSYYPVVSVKNASGYSTAISIDPFYVYSWYGDAVWCDYDGDNYVNYGEQFGLNVYFGTYDSDDEITKVAAKKLPSGVKFTAGSDMKSGTLTGTLKTLGNAPILFNVTVKYYDPEKDKYLTKTDVVHARLWCQETDKAWKDFYNLEYITDGAVNSTLINFFDDLDDDSLLRLGQDFAASVEDWYWSRDFFSKWMETRDFGEFARFTADQVKNAKASVKMTGLPSGLSLKSSKDKATGDTVYTISGTPTKLGWVTTPVITVNYNGQTYTTHLWMGVSAGYSGYLNVGQDVIDHEGDTAGTVTGGGIYGPTTKLKLTAKANNSAYTFCGWTDPEMENLPFYSSAASVTIDARTAAKVFENAATAWFVEKDYDTVYIEEIPDKTWSVLVADDYSGDYKCPIVITSWSDVTVTSTALPSGIALAKADEDEFYLNGMGFVMQQVWKLYVSDFAKLDTASSRNVTLTAKNASGQTETYTVFVDIDASSWDYGDDPLVYDWRATGEDWRYTGSGDLDTTSFVPGYKYTAKDTWRFIRTRPGVTVTCDKLPKGLKLAKDTTFSDNDVDFWGYTGSTTENFDEDVTFTVTYGPLKQEFTFRVTITVPYVAVVSACFESNYRREFPGMGNPPVVEGKLDCEWGSVTGAGSYLAGKKVTVKATPKAGYLFCGWSGSGTELLRDEDGNFTVDLRNSTLTFTMPEFQGRGDGPSGEFKFEAEFVAASLDADPSKNRISVTGVSGVDSSIRVATFGRAFSQPTNEWGEAVGPVEPFDPGEGRSGGPDTHKIDDGYLYVDESGTEVNCSVGTKLVFYVSDTSWTLPTYKVTGLPAGLKFATKAATDKDFGSVVPGMLYGVPTKAGSYPITIKTVNQSKIETEFSITLNVLPMPEWAVGTFNGVISVPALRAVKLAASEQAFAKEVVAEKYLAAAEALSYYRVVDPLFAQTGFSVFGDGLPSIYSLFSSIVNGDNGSFALTVKENGAISGTISVNGKSVKVSANGFDVAKIVAKKHTPGKYHSIVATDAPWHGVADFFEKPLCCETYAKGLYEKRFDVNAKPVFPEGNGHFHAPYLRQPVTLDFDVVENGVSTNRFYCESCCEWVTAYGIWAKFSYDGKPYVTCELSDAEQGAMEADGWTFVGNGTPYSWYPYDGSDWDLDYTLTDKLNWLDEQEYGIETMTNFLGYVINQVQTIRDFGAGSKEAKELINLWFKFRNLGDPQTAQLNPTLYLDEILAYLKLFNGYLVTGEDEKFWFGAGLPFAFRSEARACVEFVSDLMNFIDTRSPVQVIDFRVIAFNLYYTNLRDIEWQRANVPSYYWWGPEDFEACEPYINGYALTVTAEVNGKTVVLPIALTELNKLERQVAADALADYGDYNEHGRIGWDRDYLYNPDLDGHVGLSEEVRPDERKMTNEAYERYVFTYTNELEEAAFGVPAGAKGWAEGSSIGLMTVMPVDIFDSTYLINNLQKRSSAKRVHLAVGTAAAKVADIAAPAAKAVIAEAKAEYATHAEFASRLALPGVVGREAMPGGVSEWPYADLYRMDYDAIGYGAGVQDVLDAKTGYDFKSKVSTIKTTLNNYTTYLGAKLGELIAGYTQTGSSTVIKDVGIKFGNLTDKGVLTFTINATINGVSYAFSAKGTVVPVGVMADGDAISEGYTMHLQKIVAEMDKLYRGYADYEEDREAVMKLAGLRGTFFIANMVITVPKDLTLQFFDSTRTLAKNQTIVLPLPFVLPEKGSFMDYVQALIDGIPLFIEYIKGGDDCQCGCWQYVEDAFGGLLPEDEALCRENGWCPAEWLQWYECGDGCPNPGSCIYDHEWDHFYSND